MKTKYSIFAKKQVFFSRKGWTVGLILWGVISVLLITVLIPALQNGLENIPLYSLVILILTIMLLIWIWFGTYYVLTPSYLTYHAGPIWGKIPISSIVWVKHQHTLWSGIRVGLAFNGLLIRYNNYDEIYISPADKAAFIYSLQQFNPNIKVKLDNEH